MPMMTSPQVLLTLSLMLALSAQVGRATTPHIEQRSDEPVLVLTTAMEAALRAFDPEFKVRRIYDYPPTMWRRGCTWSLDCARALYTLKPREAPFAVIGDFNGDGIEDVVMDGDNAKTGRRIVLLSSGRSFSATEVEVIARADHQVVRDQKGADRGWESGLDVGLSLATPATYRTPYEPQPLALTTDGFVVNFFEKASVLFYLRNGKWNKFVLSD